MQPIISHFYLVIHQNVSSKRWFVVLTFWYFPYFLVFHQNKTYWGERANSLFCNSSRPWGSHNVKWNVEVDVECRQKWSRQNKFRWWSKVGLLEWVEDVLPGEPGLPPGPSQQPWGWRQAQQKVLWSQGLVEVGRSGNDCQSSRNHE